MGFEGVDRRGHREFGDESRLRFREEDDYEPEGAELPEASDEELERYDAGAGSMADTVAHALASCLLCYL